MFKGLMWKILVLFAFFCGQGDSSDCVPRNFGPNRIVCVCNATYCDDTPDNNPVVPAQGSFYWYVSSRAGLRMRLSKGQVDTCNARNDSRVVLNIDTTQRYQSIFGFGGAFTDSAGINIKKLSKATQDQLLRTYFDRGGSRYLIGRIPIAGTDVSTRAYSYDNYENDVTLEHFALAPEDYEYKIPLIRRALELNPELKFISTVWSPPAWMKTTEKLKAPFSFLKLDCYQLLVDYMIKFLAEYKKNGIDMWAITTGNEPTMGYSRKPRQNNLAWTPSDMGTWIVNNLGPTLRASEFNETLIVALDDQRMELPWSIQLTFLIKGASDYVSGIGVHWYTDFFSSPVLLDETHDYFPDKFLLMTEASVVDLSPEVVALGSWFRGELYFASIIEYVNHWSIGWVDWNLALDRSGGPSWTKNYIDAAIIVEPDTDEFYKQPTYYAIKHVSRFVDRGSVKVFIDETDSIKAAAFVTPLDQVVVVIFNNNSHPTNVELQDKMRHSICLELPARSFNTVIYAA